MTRRFAFLPGASGSGSFWDPVREIVQAAYPHSECVAIDWPGFGDVEPNALINSFEDLTQLVVAQLSGPTVLVAQSMGGYVATMVAHRRPDLVSHLVLCATSAGVDMDALGATDWRPGSRSAHPGNPEWMWDPTADLTSALQSIKVKTLLIWATDDPISPLSVGEHIATLIPRSRLHAFETADHWVARAFAADVGAAIVELTTPVIGFLHTAEVHVDTFNALLDAEASSPDPAGPRPAVVHLVHPQLLADARTQGLDDLELAEATKTSLQELVSQDADVIVCTCSTIGGLSEDIGASFNVPVMRSDRPMAVEAVQAGRSVAVVTAVQSTIEPTMQLLRNEAQSHGTNPTISSEPCLEAWALFESGDVDAYHRAIAEHVHTLQGRFDVVVLAQASMLGAMAYIDTRIDTATSGASRGTLVLASPPAAVAAAINAASR
jgi:poly(3-hydroxyoctanoate) depolymerase